MLTHIHTHTVYSSDVALFPNLSLVQQGNRELIRAFNSFYIYPTFAVENFCGSICVFRQDPQVRKTAYLKRWTTGANTHTVTQLAQSLYAVSY